MQTHKECSLFHLVLLDFSQMKKSLFLSIIPLLTLSGCITVAKSNSSKGSSKGEESEVEASLSSSVESLSRFSENADSSEGKSDSGLFDELFSSASSLSIQLRFSNASLMALSKLQSASRKYDDVYFPADMELELNGVKYAFAEVGVRMKGNTSRRAIVNNDNVIYQPCHFKVSFKETFDSEIYDDPKLSSFRKSWESAESRAKRKDRTLFGQKKIDLKYIPRNNGTCKVREIYAYQSFEKEGLLAPKATLASLTVSNDSSTLDGEFEVIECIDKQFLKKRFSKADAKGDLYKCVYNSRGKADLSRSGAVTKDTDPETGRTIGTRVAKGNIGVEDNWNGYVPNYQLKTNDDNGEESDFTSLSNYINGIWNTVYGPDGGSSSMIESVLDVDQFLKFSAVSYLLGNPDDQRYNYNNYYIYFIPSTGKAVYIPYDWDWCLGSAWNEGLQDNMKSTTPFDEWTIDNGTASSVYYATFFKGKKDGMSLTFDRSSYQNAYLSYVKKGVEDGILDPENYLSLTNTLHSSDNNEYESVSSYMNVKRARINS